MEGFAKLAAPLHKIVAEFSTSKGRKPTEQAFPEAWMDDCNASFEALKGKLITTPILAYADFSLPFILKVDASYGGLGPVLSEHQGDKVQTVAYANWGLHLTERIPVNYSSVKLEFLALKWAMTEKSREYLL